MSQRAVFRRRQRTFRWATLGLVLLFFALPLIASFEFTTRGFAGQGRSAETWATLFDWGQVTRDYPVLRQGLLASIGLSVITVLVMLTLLVPTMTWVRLRLPGLSRTVEFICLLPLTIPAIVLVVGLTPVYSWLTAWMTYFFGPTVGESTQWLALAYVILVLPYAYRALDAGLRAIDVRTLAEAARSLGGSWFTVMWRVILPNLRTAVLASSFLGVALVLGEFTIASLFARKNLQVAMYEIGLTDARMSVAVALAALGFAFLVLFAMSFVGSRQPGAARVNPFRRTRKVGP